MAPEKALTKRSPCPQGRITAPAGSRSCRRTPPLRLGEAPSAAPRRPAQPDTAIQQRWGFRSPPGGAATKRHRAPRARRSRGSPAAHFPQRSSPLKSLPRSFTPRQRRADTRVHLLIPQHRGRGAGVLRWPSAPTARARAAGSARGSRSPTSGRRSAAHHEQPPLR